MKATPKELELHLAIKGNIHIALSKLYYMYGDQIVRILKYRYQAAAKRDEAHLFEAVNEALLGYYRNPDTFNPVKFTLLSFLIVAADRDLQNILAREKKHLNRKDLPEDVELGQKDRNSIIKGQSSADDTILYDETMTIIQNLLESLFPNERDVRMAWMVLAGTREMHPFSEVLEIGNLTIPEQRMEVKKHKDRIKQVLRRNDVENRIKNLLR